MQEKLNKIVAKIKSRPDAKRIFSQIDILLNHIAPIIEEIKSRSSYLTSVIGMLPVFRALYTGKYTGETELQVYLRLTEFHEIYQDEYLGPMIQQPYLWSIVLGELCGEDDAEYIKLVRSLDDSTEQIHDRIKELTWNKKLMLNKIHQINKMFGIDTQIPDPPNPPNIL